jgi:hypothetical protein
MHKSRFMDGRRGTGLQWPTKKQSLAEHGVMKKCDRGQFWGKAISEQAGCGLSVRAFCKERRLGESEFYLWQRKLKSRANKQPATSRRDASQKPSRPSEREATVSNKERGTAVRAKADSVAPKATPTVKGRSAKSAVSALRKEERYRLRGSKAVRVEIETDTGDESRTLDAELLDISEGGVRLRSKTPVAMRDSLTINIMPAGFSKSLSARAKVCWTTLAPKGSHWLGCSIEPRIPPSVLEHLATGGVLERRHDSRRDVSMTLAACWELDPTRLEALVSNLSPGGACLAVAKPGNPGDRIRLTLPGDNQKPTYIFMTACWQIDTDDGFIVGCTFCHHRSYEKLLQLADAQQPKP